MKFLLDLQQDKVRQKQSLYPELVAGQLCTPLTRYKNWGGSFAIDNGAYSGLDKDGFFRLLASSEEAIDRCIFVAVPDIVGNARRTVELYFQITQDKRMWPYTKKWAMVMQDGHEDMAIDWNAIRVLFIGGTDRFKNSQAALDIVKCAKALDRHVHVGRVNEIRRYKMYAEAGADTCDGSGVCMYDHMLRNIHNELSRKPDPTFFDQMENESEA